MAQESSVQTQQENTDQQTTDQQDGSAQQEAPPEEAGGEGGGADAADGGAESAEEPATEAAADALDGIDKFLSDVMDFASDPSWTGAIEVFGPPLLWLGQAIVALVVLMVVVSFVGRWVQRLLRVTLVKARIDETVAQFLAKAARYGIWIVALPIAFEIFGMKTGSLVAVVGAAGLAIGLAMQGSLSNIAAGVMLATLRPFRLGDWVELDGEFGVVEDIGIFHTRVTTFTNRLIILPNSSILNAKIENFTSTSTVRVDVPIGVAYGSDLRAAHEALMKAAKSDYTGKARESDADVVLVGFGDSSIDFQVRAWANSKQLVHAQSGIVMNINDALAEAKIEIPFPQRDLHIRDSVKIGVVREGGDNGDAGSE